MTKISKLILSLAIVSFGSIVLAAGYCPSNAEFHAKMDGYKQSALNDMQNPTITTEEISRKLNEQKAYMNAIFPNCLQYFKTTQTPDCSKLAMLSSGYMFLEDAKQPAAKAQTYALLNSLYGKCKPYELDTVKIMVK